MELSLNVLVLGAAATLVSGCRETKRADATSVATVATVAPSSSSSTSSAQHPASATASAAAPPVTREYVVGKRSDAYDGFE
jgi:hypothetical protein